MTSSPFLSSARRVAMSGAALLTLALLPGIAAHADVKVVSETTFTGVSGAPGPSTSTIYYKGEKQRTETPDRVTIYDCAADTLYTLDPKTKTYTVSTGADIGGAPTKNPLLAMTKIETKEATLTPVPGTRTIAGKAASSYAYTLVLHISPSDPSLNDFIPNLTATVKGVQWTTEATSMPPTCERMARLNITRVLPGAIAGMGTGIKDLADKVGQIKGLFLNSRLEFTMKPDKGGDTQMPLPKDPIVVTTEVKSLTEDPLDDSLFAIPADYKKAVPPPAVTPAPPAGAAPAPAAPTEPASK